MDEILRITMKKNLFIIFSTLFLFACAGKGANEGELKLNPQSNISRDNVDKLYIVDCLLPGQVRSLGRSANYITPRRPIKTSAVDCEIRGGEYVSFDRADYATALKIWLPQAQAGDAAAQTHVGEIYEKGMGIQPDYEVAALWYKKAAKQNYSRAQINLGYLYEKGLGVEQDIGAAMNWYRKASGLPEDIQYVSSVELSAKNEELQSLRDEVKKLEEEKQKYKKQLRHSQQKLKNVENEKNSTESNITALKSRINNLQTSLEQSKQTNQTAVVVRETPSTGTTTTVEKVMPPKEVQHLIQKLFAQLKDKESDLQQQGLIIAKLHKETSTFKKQLANVELQQLALAGPSIEILDPPLSLTRGKPSILLRSPVKSQDIFGRVNAPAGLKKFVFNDSRLFLRPDNSFRIPVPIDSSLVNVKLEAIDKRDKTTTLDFVISSPKGLPAQAPVLTTRLTSQIKDVDVGQYYALVIGNNKYKSLPNLKTAVNDAKETAKVLKDKYGFKVKLLIDVDRYEILSALHELRQTLSKKDNLLVYYAGHGDLDKVNDRGYWLPVDADADNTANWISNVAITDMLNALNANHIMVVADSCYSGTMTRTAVPRVDSTIPAAIQKKWIELMAKSRSRTVLSSGGVQPVLDEGSNNHSIFANAFLRTLKQNNDVLQGYALYREVSQDVSTNSSNIQTPEYAPIKHAGHETGQFFFIPKT